MRPGGGDDSARGKVVCQAGGWGQRQKQPVTLLSPVFCSHLSGHLLEFCGGAPGAHSELRAVVSYPG